jgi:hypothetical protein
MEGPNEMSENDARECVLEGIRPGWAAVLILAFAASACSGMGVDETVLDEADSDYTPPVGARTSAASEADEPADVNALNGGLTGRSVASTITWYRWTKGDPALTLQPSNSHVCALSMIRGDFGSATVFSLEPDSSGNWILNGLTQAAGLLQIDAVCMPKSTFLTNNGTLVHLNNGNVAFNKTNYQTSVGMMSKTAPMLSSLTGAFNGFGEEAWVVKSWGDPFIDGLFLKNGTASGWHIAKAHVLNFGRQRVPTYTLDESYQVPENQSMQCNSAGGGCPSLLNEFCFITGMGGKLRGQGEWFQVFPNFTTYTWDIQAHALSNGRVIGHVACLAMDQR